MLPYTCSQAAAFLRERDNFLILTHRRPDGDTVGCAAALCRGLRSLGKTAVIYPNPQFSALFAPYVEGLTAEILPENPCVISVDIATAGLLPYGAEDYVNQIALRIDHHGRETLGARAWVVPEAAACGELILELLHELNAPIDPKTAEALYCAISTDTGCFRYSNVTANTLRAAAECKELGADIFAVNQVMFLTKKLSRLRLNAHLTEHLELYGEGRVAVNLLPDSLLAELGLTEDDIQDISGFAREIEGVNIAVMLRNAPEGAKLSVRCAPGYDASQICARFGGGGHRGAAGATLNGELQEAKELVLQALGEMELI